MPWTVRPGQGRDRGWEERITATTTPPPAAPAPLGLLQGQAMTGFLPLSRLECLELGGGSPEFLFPWREVLDKNLGLWPFLPPCLFLPRGFHARQG